MADDAEKIIFACKYNSVKELFDNEVIPLVNTIYLLSYSANNYASAASLVSNVNVTETHEIKELLDLTFDIRKLSEKLLDITECRTEEAIKAVRTGIFDLKKPPESNTNIPITISPTSVISSPAEKKLTEEKTLAEGKKLPPGKK